MAAFQKVKGKFASVARDESGLAFIEFAVSFTMLLIMFFGAIELSRYILIVQKVEKTADTLPDVLTQVQANTLKDGDVFTYLGFTSILMSPYSVGIKGAIIISDIQTAGDPTNPIIQWQVCGGGSYPARSKLGAPNGRADLSVLDGGFTMSANEEVVVGEMFYVFTPIISTQTIITPATIYRTGVFKPRYGYNTMGMQTSQLTCH